MTSERVRVVKGLVDEHGRLVAASKKSKRRTRPLNTQMPSLNPILKRYTELGIDPKDFRDRS